MLDTMESLIRENYYGPEGKVMSFQLSQEDMNALVLELTVGEKTARLLQGVGLSAPGNITRSKVFFANGKSANLGPDGEVTPAVAKLVNTDQRKAEEAEKDAAEAAEKAAARADAEAKKPAAR